MSFPADDQIPIGMELAPLGTPDENAPTRLTVDVFVRDERGERIERWQVTGVAVAQRERTIEELAAVFDPLIPSRAEDVARKLDELDRAACRDVAERLRRLRREQALLIHGPATLAWLDERAAVNGAREQEETDG